MRWHLRKLGLMALAVFTLATARAAAPDDLSAGIRVWLDGLDVRNNQTLPADAAPVTTWVPKAGVTGTMTLNTAGAAPVYSYLGGVPQGVKIAESNVWYVLPGGIYKDNEVVRTTDIFVVNNLSAITAGRRGDTRLFSNTLNENSSLRMSSHAPWFNGDIIWDHGVVRTGGRQSLVNQFVGPNSAINVKTLWNYQSNNTSPTVQYIARDGVIGVRSGQSFPYTQEPGSVFEVGKQVNSVIGELIIYSRILTDVERTLMLNYLHARHQLPNPLPASMEKFAAGKAAGYRYQLGGIGQSAGMAVSRGTTYGLTIQNVNFLDNDAYLLAAVKTLFPTPGISTQDVDPTFNAQRSSTSWYIQNAKGSTGQVTLSVDTAKVWGTLPAVGKRMALLYRGPGTQFQTIAAQPVEVTAANQANLSFTVDNIASGEYALAELLAPDHYEIIQDGQALACQPKTVTVKACQNATCTSTVPYTVSGTLVWTGNPAGVPFVINPGTVAGSGSTTVPVSVSNPQTVVLGANAWSITATATPAVQCKNGAGVVGSCSVAFNPTGFVVRVPNHRSCTAAPVTVEAVQTQAGSNRCVAAYGSVTRSVRMFTTYSNPGSGTMVASVLGPTTVPIGTSAANPSTHNLVFDASGKASFNLSYADAGQISLTVMDIAPNNATMQGSQTFTAVPASLAISNLPTGPLKAGADFTVALSAMNSCPAPGITPNFDNQTVTVSSSNPQPAQGNALAINTGTTTSRGTATPTLQWAEVGKVDIAAKLVNYFNTGMDVSSTAATVGPFVPSHFATTVDQGCAVGNFTYSGAPFKVTVTAQALKGTTTANYAGALARQVTLSNGGDIANFKNNTIAATDFVGGVARNTKISWTFANPTPPGSAALPRLVLRATETGDATVTSLRAAPATSNEGTVNIRSGRLFLQNTYGDGRLPLPLVLEARYWNGSAYQRNTDDSCTTIPASSIVMSGWTSKLMACQTAVSFANNVATFTAGQAKNLQLSAPGAAYTGSVLLTPNLGASAAGQTCVGAAPDLAIGANAPWLGPVAGATATFGSYKSPLVYRRENY